MRDPPSGHRRGRRFERVAAAPPRPPQQEGYSASALSRELEAPGLCHLDAAGLADHRTKPAMPQSFLDKRQQLRVVAGLGIDDARRIEPGLEETWGEQVP